MYSLLLAGNRGMRDDSQFRLAELAGIIETVLNFSTVILISNDESLVELVTTRNQLIFQKVPSQTAGALATAAFGLNRLTDSEPFLIIPSNARILNDGIMKFQSSMGLISPTVGAMIFQETNPLYSYARLDKFGVTIEITEKQVFGDCALAGVYYFNNKRTFIKCVEWAMVNNVQTDGRFFISPALNYFLANSIEISLFEISSRDYARL